MKTFFGWLLTAIVLLVVYATALPLFDVSQWWIRAFGFPRMQVAIVAAVVAVALGAFYWHKRPARIAIVLLAACALYQFIEIFPYTPLAREQSLPAVRNAPQRSLSLLVANVLMRNRNIEAFARQIRSSTPDVIFAIETDEWWAGQLRFLESIYPYVIREPLSNTYGMLVMSRRKLLDVQVRHLLGDSIPSIRATVELPSGETVDLYCVHPQPPVSSSDSANESAEIVRIAREVRERGRPAIVAGDFNDVAWSRTTRRFRDVSGMLDPRVGRGMYNSFHAGHFFLRYSLDHLFHTPHFRLLELRRLENIGSDHFPLFVALSYEPDKADTL